MAKELDPRLQLKYNKFYIGLEREGKAFNFVTFTPRKTNIVFEPRIDRSEELDNAINDSGLDSLSYDNQWGRYRMRLSKADIQKQEGFLKTLMKSAFDAGTGVCPPNTDVTASAIYKCHSSVDGVGRRAGAEPSVAQRSTDDRFTGARNRTRYLPSGRQLARLVEQLSRL